VLKIIAEVQNSEYYLLRAMEQIQVARKQMTKEAKESLTLAIRLIVMAMIEES